MFDIVIVCVYDDVAIFNLVKNIKNIKAIYYKRNINVD